MRKIEPKGTSGVDTPFVQSFEHIAATHSTNHVQRRPGKADFSVSLFGMAWDLVIDRVASSTSSALKFGRDSARDSHVSRRSSVQPAATSHEVLLSSVDNQFWGLCEAPDSQSVGCRYEAN
jgi:hypothetical protein